MRHIEISLNNGTAWCPFIVWVRDQLRYIRFVKLVLLYKCFTCQINVIEEQCQFWLNFKLRFFLIREGKLWKNPSVRGSGCKGFVPIKAVGVLRLLRIANYRNRTVNVRDVIRDKFPAKQVDFRINFAWCLSTGVYFLKLSFNITTVELCLISIGF